MSEFQELEKLLKPINSPALSARCINGKWNVRLSDQISTGAYLPLIEHTEHRLDTALTLILQDLRDAVGMQKENNT